MTDAASLIARYQLQPHPEGGWFRELHRCEQTVQRAGGEPRSALTVILFLLEAPEVSRWHRVRGADETWHFIGGDPLELLLLPEGEALSRQWLGFHPGDPSLTPLAVVPAGSWQAARSLGIWSLVSCCVGPGFSFCDFDLLADQPAAERPAAALPEFL